MAETAERTGPDGERVGVGAGDDVAAADEADGTRSPLSTSGEVGYQETWDAGNRQ